MTDLTAPGSRATLSALYPATLLDDVMPFWLRHGIDKQHGGIGNLLDDQGNVTGTDKYLWSQGRALWTFSALCNRIDRRGEARRAAGQR